MKLRTLKDFEVLFCNDCDNDVAISVKELKEEAIKHIQFYENTEEDIDISEWIKHFFNISEEDLTKEVNAEEHGEVGNN